MSESEEKKSVMFYLLKANAWLLYQYKAHQLEFFFDKNSRVFRLDFNFAALYFCVSSNGLFIKDSRFTDWFTEINWEKVLFVSMDKANKPNFIRLVSNATREEFQVSKRVCAIKTEGFFLDIPIEKKLFEIIKKEATSNGSLCIGQIKPENLSCTKKREVRYG